MKTKQIWLWLQIPRNSTFTLTHGHIFHCLPILENSGCCPKYRSLACILSKISLKAKSLFLANNFSINQDNQSFLADEHHKPTTYLTGDDFDCLKLATKTGGQKSKFLEAIPKKKKIQLYHSCFMQKEPNQVRSNHINLFVWFIFDLVYSPEIIIKIEFSWNSEFTTHNLGTQNW